MKIGLMGGTFNPVHLGHLLISEYIRENFPLDLIIFIPSGNPPHKDLDHVIDANHRYNMVNLAIKDNPYFTISDIEIKRSGKSYTIDTIDEIKKRFPNDSIYFIIGGDSLYNLTTWKDYRSLFIKTSFILIDRHGIEENKMINYIKELKEEFGANIDFIDGPQIEISSTNIRKNLINNKSIKYMVTKEVEDYITKNRLYLMGD